MRYRRPEGVKPAPVRPNSLFWCEHADRSSEENLEIRSDRRSADSPVAASAHGDDRARLHSRTPSIRSSTTPTVIAESATLNAGQCQRP